MTSAADAGAPDVQVETRGRVLPDEVDYAREKVRALLGRVREPVLYARLKLLAEENPAMERPAVMQASVDVNGRPARAHVAAPRMQEAADLLQDRLARQLDQLDRHWEARRGKRPLAHEWRHDSEPAHRPDYFPRPVEEREVVRHKSFSLARETPDEAAFEMESMDYDFHLFTDADTGEDSVLYRSGPTGYRLAQVRPRPELMGPVAVSLTLSEQSPPRLDVAGARQRLEEGGYPFVFFVDEDTGRGNLLYHRYDGHYGLITPADD
ncbi:HPF/RaiA family ribosome-associated protein [Streptomyces sodiiphilus]|uniref:HPF/RaiA family ribosome-associated protein n=1 Tax=Streptomyces sodiiphilus TaxID=226217 RepID=A0ABP5AIG2_9ACTN